MILCLVSGGASSLVCLPRKGLTLAAKRRAVCRARGVGRVDPRAQPAADVALGGQGRRARPRDARAPGDARAVGRARRPRRRRGLGPDGPRPARRPRAHRGFEPRRARCGRAGGAASRVARAAARAAACPVEARAAGERIARAMATLPPAHGAAVRRRDGRAARTAARGRGGRSLELALGAARIGGRRASGPARGGLGRPRRQLDGRGRLRGRADAWRGPGGWGSTPGTRCAATTRTASSRSSAICS